MDPVLAAFDRRFRMVDERSRQFLLVVGDDRLYRRPRETERRLLPFSSGEYIVRSAAMVEKTFGGITTKLWDDPFEWTLPEKLVAVTDVVDYLNEVERTRVAGFEFIGSDDQLLRAIPSPERLRPILDILLECVSNAEHYQGRAFAIFQMLSDEKLPRV